MDSRDLRSECVEQQRQSARATTLIGAVVALVAFSAWGIFDRLVLPAQAHEFLTVRIGFEVAILIGWLTLRAKRIGGRWPEQTAFAVLTLPQLAISWMIPRSGDELEAYLLGLSLAIYASAFLIVSRWQLTALLVGFTAATVGTSYSSGPDPSAHQIAIAVFYLGTAGALAIAAQLYRQHIGWQRFVIESDLEAERVRNAALVDELEQLSREDALTGVGNRRVGATHRERTAQRLPPRQHGVGDPVRPRPLQSCERHLRARDGGPCAADPRSTAHRPGANDRLRRPVRRR